MLRSVITKITKAFKHIRALDELLDALAEEMAKTERLEMELEKEKQLRVDLENRLTEFGRVLKNSKEELNLLRGRLTQLEKELNSVLEASLLRYLKDSDGKLPLNEYVKEYGTTPERVVDALKSLHKKGLIKMSQEKNEG